MRRWTRRLTFVALVTLALAAAGSLTASAACPPLDITAGRRGHRHAVRVSWTTSSIPSTRRWTTRSTLWSIRSWTTSSTRGRIWWRSGRPPRSHRWRWRWRRPRSGTAGPARAPGARGRRRPGARRGVARKEPRRPRAHRLAGADDLGRIGSRATRHAQDRTSGDRFGEVLGGVARSLAIVLALFGLAVAFVAIQDRLDRSDPRLALAPVESDVVEFA